MLSSRLLLEFFAFTLAFMLVVPELVETLKISVGKARLTEAFYAAPLDLRRCQLEKFAGNDCILWDLNTSSSKFHYNQNKSALTVKISELTGKTTFSYEPVSDGSRYIRLKCHSDNPNLTLSSCDRKSYE